MEEDERVAGEDEEAPCSSESLNFLDFDFLSGEVIPRVPSNEDEVNEVDRSEKYGEYLSLHRP